MAVKSKVTYESGGAGGLAGRPADQMTGLPPALYTNRASKRFHCRIQLRKQNLSLLYGARHPVRIARRLQSVRAFAHRQKSWEGQAQQK